MRLGQHLSPSGEKVVISLLQESDEFLDFADAMWVLHEKDTEKVLVKTNDMIQESIWIIARHHRFDRELAERYGMFKGVLLHPTVLWLSDIGGSAWRDFRVFGNPPISPKASFILLVMMYSKAPNWVLLCASLVLLAVNPIVLVAVLFFITSMAFQRRRNYNPKGYIPQQLRKMQPSVNVNTVADNNAANMDQMKATDNLLKCYKGLSIPSGKFDAVVLGSELGGLVFAGLLSCLGWRVLVLEEGPTIGGGTLVRVSNKEGKRKGEDDDNDLGRVFDVGFQPLGLAFGFRRILETILRFRAKQKQQQHSGLSNDEPLRWVPVGLADSALATDIVNRGGGNYGNSGNDPLHNTNMSSIELGEAHQTVYVSEMVRIGDRGPLIPIPGDVSRLYANLLKVIPEMAKSSKVVETLTRVMNDEVLHMSKLQNTRIQSQKAAERTKHVSTLLSSNDAIGEDCNALGKTVEDVFKGIVSTEGLEILSSIFGGGNAVGKELSVSAYCNYFMNMTFEPCYPVGGLGRILNGLVEVIEQSGGKVQTNVPGCQLCCNADGAEMGSGGGSIAVKGVKICRSVSPCNVGEERYSNADSDIDSLIVPCPVVASATGALDTYYRRISEADLKNAGGVPSDLHNVYEGKPHCHLLLQFEENWVSLKGSSFRLRVIRNTAAKAALDSQIEQSSYNSSINQEWLSITFMEPRDPDTWTRSSTTSCVISSELPEDCCLDPSHVDPSPRCKDVSRMCRPAHSNEELKSCKTIQKLQARMLATLQKEFPQTTTAKVLLRQWVQDRLPRLNHNCGRAVAVDGLRPHTPIKGLYLCGRDISPINSEGGSIIGALLAAEAVLGYTIWDTYLGNDLISDLRALPTN